MFELNGKEHSEEELRNVNVSVENGKRGKKRVININ